MRKFQFNFCLILVFLLGNSLNMSAQNNNVAQCILDQIQFLEDQGTVFNKVQTYLGIDAESEINFQFSTDIESACTAKLVFVRENQSERIGTVTLQLAKPSSMGALAATFPKFKTYPSTPGGTRSAMASYETDNPKQSYTVILESKEEILPDTPIHTIVIRIDYED